MNNIYKDDAGIRNTNHDLIRDMIRSRTGFKRKNIKKGDFG